MIQRNQGDELGVSEVVGFIIVLGIVFMAIGMVYANAIPVLEDNREHQHITNTEKIFSTLDGNVDEITERDVSRRATHIRLFDSEVSLGNPTYQINVSGETGLSPDWDIVRGASTLTYEHGEEQIIYENGAVIRTSTARNDSAMLVEPGWTVRENEAASATYTAILQNVRFQGFQELSGDGPILVRKQASLRSDVMKRIDSDDVTIRVTSEHADAWQAYFESIEDASTRINTRDVGDDAAQIEFEQGAGDRVMYKDYLIEARITA